MMQVYLLKDVENVGMSGQVVKVSDGYAINFLIPRKLATRIGSSNEDFFKSQVKKIEIDKKALSNKISMLAEKIKNLHLTIKEKIHDDGKLYGSVSADEIVELLKEKEISVNKKQIDFPKAIKKIGEHKVIVKLSSKLKPEFILKVVEK
ncbi:MAG: 50S ribosomal protein L9, partial [bacterium]